MIQIENTLLSFDLFEKKFCCDLSQCKGICCVEGDAGAPLRGDEAARIEADYAAIRPYMAPAGVEAVRQQGFAVLDREGDLGTPLVGNRECAYAIVEDGICWCAIEKAWKEGKTSFRKPISCHLYPVRVSDYGDFEALNYHQWSVCRCARIKGGREGIPLYRFLREPLIARYGEEWYAQVEYAAHEIETGRVQVPPER